MSEKISWKGVDSGREGLLKADKWFKTLSVLSEHEGSLITDYSAPLYRELFEEMPDESWLGKNGDRSLFRDYQACWTSFGVLKRTGETGHTIELTNQGRELVRNGRVIDFFRSKVNAHYEEKEIGGVYLLVYPYRVIAAALLALDGQGVISISGLQERAQQYFLFSICGEGEFEFDGGDTSGRRFRSYLTILENAKVIKRLPNGTIEILDRGYAELLAEELLSWEMRDESVEGIPDNMYTDLRRRGKTPGFIREGQSKFSEEVKKAYSYTCCITGSKESSVLQAAHILDYLGPQTNFINNGICLAQDVHAMFDSGRLFINPSTLCVEFPPDMTDERYLRYSGKHISLPESSADRPSKEALLRKYKLATRSQKMRLP